MTLTMISAACTAISRQPAAQQERHPQVPREPQQHTAVTACSRIPPETQGRVLSLELATATGSPSNGFTAALTVAV
jgi:hypothetical protein